MTMALRLVAVSALFGLQSLEGLPVDAKALLTGAFQEALDHYDWALKNIPRI